MTDNKREQLGEALYELAEALPPHLREKFARDVVKAIGPDKVSEMIMATVMANEEPFTETVAEIKKLGDRGEQLLEHTKPFLGSLKDAGKDFHECWAAMVLLLSISANNNALVEMLGYCLTWITFNGQVPVTPDTPESAAAKFSAARNIADEFLDLANALRDERSK